MSNSEYKQRVRKSTIQILTPIKQITGRSIPELIEHAVINMPPIKSKKNNHEK